MVESAVANIKRYEIEEEVDLGGGAKATFVYRDAFDVNALKIRIADPQVPIKERLRLARRLLVVNAATVEELQAVVGSNNQ
jgi:hypothetical protein